MFALALLGFSLAAQGHGFKFAEKDHEYSSGGLAQLLLSLSTAQSRQLGSAQNREVSRSIVMADELSRRQAMTEAAAVAATLLPAAAHAASSEATTDEAAAAKLARFQKAADEKFEKKLQAIRDKAAAEEKAAIAKAVEEAAAAAKKAATEKAKAGDDKEAKKEAVEKGEAAIKAVDDKFEAKLQAIRDKAAAAEKKESSEFEKKLRQIRMSQGELNKEDAEEVLERLKDRKYVVERYKKKGLDSPCTVQGCNNVNFGR